MKTILSVLVTLLCSLFAQAEVDTITIFQSHAVDIGGSGDSCVWDFSSLSENEAYDVFISSSANNKVETLKMGTRYNYSLRNDTLFLCGFENATSIISYTNPVPALRFPLILGDTIHGEYVGFGEYAHLLPITVSGDLRAVVDGRGCLILPNQQFNNVFRVSTEHRLTESMLKSNSFFIEEHRWFAQGNFRYPLLEMIDVKTISDTATTSSRLTFYCFVDDSSLVRSQRSIIGEEILDSLPLNFPLQDIHLLPNPVVDNLFVSFRVARQSAVGFSLCNRQGLFVYNSSAATYPEGEWSATIPMDSLPKDDYVLYISADNLLTSAIIIKK